MAGAAVAATLSVTKLPAVATIVGVKVVTRADTALAALAAAAATVLETVAMMPCYLEGCS